uniref:CCHC-type domain-containing protein n=1 Tax=Nicotiana tabacum TaxID=4097 RepID=A0A1S4CF80_TOBAC|nr:PREDICTED: uncharacterized protein LOC107818192 [Nicotiana tabacum]
MKEGESVEEMFARFSKIIRDLKAFGKPYSSDDQVRKILRSLPTTWQTKVVTLESRDLNKLSCDELRGELIAFEKTHLKKTSQKKKKKKTVAFKATTERVDNDIDVDPEALQEEIAMVSRNMDGLMRIYRNTRRGMILSRRTRQYNEQDKNDGKCYECGRFGHVQAECPDLKRKVFRGFKKNKSFGSQSDEDSSEHEEIANLCFMTILENDMNKLSGCWTDEDTSDDKCKDDNENCFMAREESLHVIFDENNTSAKKGIIAGDEDQIQEIQETSKSQESANKPDGVMESTNEVMNSQSESPKESTTHTSTIRPNERRSEPEYPQKLIIGDPNEGIKTRGALKKKANIALISQIEPKKIKEAQKDSSWLQVMQEELDLFEQKIKCGNCCLSLKTFL